MAILAIDFDGVLHDHLHPAEGGVLGAPIEGAKASMRLLREQGHKLVIFSVKPPDIIDDWCRNFDIPFDRITTLKPEADAYIDDKAIRFFNWKLTLASLKWNLP
jgi:phosphoglycolate phosphatase-like HAD superfamily hydrolase